eukprot:scaffold181350_cov28-Tisochrysis_lutea.AAC.4
MAWSLVRNHESTISPPSKTMELSLSARKVARSSIGSAQQSSVRHGIESNSASVVGASWIEPSTPRLPSSASTPTRATPRRTRTPSSANRSSTRLTIFSSPNGSPATMPPEVGGETRVTSAAGTPRDNSLIDVLQGCCGGLLIRDGVGAAKRCHLLTKAAQGLVAKLRCEYKIVVLDHRLVRHHDGFALTVDVEHPPLDYLHPRTQVEGGNLGGGV